jgi:hypothetical protein
MSESLLDLVFGVQTLNSPQVRFAGLRKHQAAQSLFERGADFSAQVRGGVVDLTDVEFLRRPAPFTLAKSPAPAVEGRDLDKRTFVLADVKISSQPIPLELIVNEDAGLAILRQEMAHLNLRKTISKEILATQALKGAVSVSAATVPGTKVSFAYTQPVTAHSPGAAWNNAGTKLVSSEFELLATAAEDASGMEIEQIWSDRLIKKYITQNTEVQVVTTGGERKSDALARTTQVLGGTFADFELNGWNWGVTGTKYDTGTGEAKSLTKYLGDNQLIALPDDDMLPMVLGRALGRGAIPTQAIGAAGNPMGQAAPELGDYSYAFQIPNPAAVTIVSGWKGIFFLTWAEAVTYMANVNSP